MRFRRQLLAILACAPLLAAVVSAASARPAAQGTPVEPWCVSSTDQTAQFMQATLVRLATSTDSITAAVRDSLAHMPVTLAADITMLSDEALCQRASASLDSSFFATPQASPVYLARVGARYAIRPRDARAGEFSYLVYTDTAFNRLAVGTF